MSEGPVRENAQGLTDRQLAVARLVAAGHTDKRIAARLRCSEDNVHRLIVRIARRWHLDFSRSLRVQIACRVAAGAPTAQDQEIKRV